MHRRHVAIVRTTQGFAVEGEVLAEVGTALEDPVPQDGFECIDIEPAEGRLHLTRRAGVDFYARQEAARRTTRWLLLAFLVSVALVVVAIDVIVVVVLGAADPAASPTRAVVFTSVVALAVMVNMVELLCTAGLPAVYTQVLANQGVSGAGYYAYLALYNVAYMVDDAAMLVVAVATLSQRKLQERGGRVLKLVSGLIMVTLGLLLLFKPAWLVWS